MRFLVLLFIAFILVSLFSALYFLLKDKGRSERTVKALTVRVVLSILLFALVMLGYRFGFISHRLGS
jgi:predicted PurR-regulated permease PerM